MSWYFTQASRLVLIVCRRWQVVHRVGATGGWRVDTLQSRAYSRPALRLLELR
jgi:hypothetical protein